MQLSQLLLTVVHIARSCPIVALLLDTREITRQAFDLAVALRNDRPLDVVETENVVNIIRCHRAGRRTGLVELGGSAPDC